MELYYCLILLLVQSCGANVEHNALDNVFSEEKMSMLEPAPLRHDAMVYNDSAVDPYHEQPQKRGVVSVLIGISVLLAVANVATDVFLANKCCAIGAKGSCEYVPKIKLINKRMLQVGEDMDAGYLSSQLDITYLTDIDTKNGLLRNEIDRLRQLEQDIIFTMEPDLHNKFKQIAEDIKQKWKKGKKNVDSVITESTKLYKPLYATWVGRAQLFSGVGLQVAGELGSALKRRYDMRFKVDVDPEVVAEMKKLISTETPSARTGKAKRLLQGTDKLDDVATRMAKSKANLDVSKVKVSKLTVGFSFVAIGAEIFSLYTKFKSCKDSLDRIKGVHKNATDKLKQAEITLKAIESGQQVINKQYVRMKDGLSGVNFITVIKHFKKFIQEASPAAKERMYIADRNIDIFLKYINVTNPSLTSSLQVILTEGLKKITIKYKCLLIRVQTQTAISTSCKQGAATLKALYLKKAQETLLTNCVTAEGEPFTTFKQMKDFIVTDSKNKTNPWNPNCRLNNKHLVTSMCTMKCKEGYAYTEIIKRKETPEITAEELTKLCEPCPKLELNPYQKIRICSMKICDKRSIVMVHIIWESINGKKYGQKAIIDTYNKCDSQPKPNCSL